MESPLVDDDICILKHETAYMAESPVAVCSGDESVASHFALVTAYEDIKKRLRDTEKENTLLRKRVKQLEDKVFRPEAPPSEGPQYMNKAFSAYRGIYMEKKDLQAELNKLKKERVESERLLTEQLQAKELELLQLKSEMETSQVMRSLNETQDYWQVERGSHELQLHTLQQQLERLKLENSQLHKVCGLKQVDSKSSVVNNDDNQEVAAESREVAVLRLYEGVCSEMLWLQALVKTQTDLMKKIRNKPLPLVLRRAASALPVQCRDDVEKNSSPVRVTAPRPPSAPPLPCASARSGPSTAPLLADGLQGNCWKEPWPLQRPPPLGSPAGPPNASQHGASLDDSSWSIPSHPRPSDAKFWESPKSSSSSTDWAKPY